MRKRHIICFVFSAYALLSAIPAYGTLLDLTVEYEGTINGAILQRFSPETSTGTGQVEPFVRIQGKGVQEGYNTDGTAEFETKSSLWTNSLLLSDVAVVLIDGVNYRGFLLDINQSKGSRSLLSLDELKVYLEPSGNLTGYPAGFGSPVYDLDAGEDSWVKLDTGLAGSGSGSGDMLALIPDSVFAGSGQYVYLYSKFGMNESCNGGFEEWATQVPEPGTLFFFGLGAVLLRRKCRTTTDSAKV
jgi:hypothetical protein